MNSRIDALFIISCLGVILSITASIYESVHYLSVSHNAQAVRAIAPIDDSVLLRVDQLLTGVDKKDVILNALKTVDKQVVSFHSTLTNVLEDSKANSLSGALLWFGASIIYAILAIRLDAIRRSKKNRGR